MAGRETPATRAVQAAGVPHRLHAYAHDPAAHDFGAEAVRALGVDAERVLKTLVISTRDGLAVAILPVADTLDLRALGKGAALAPPERAQAATGYVVGGISPLGQRRRLATLFDAGALAHPTVFVSAGRRGLELELAPADLVALTAAQVRPLTRAAA